MSLRENWKAAQERDRQRPEAEAAGHRRYVTAWELHKLGVPVMSPNGGPDPALTEAALDRMLAAETGRRARLYAAFARAGTVTVFPALGQILPDDDTVYTIGKHDPLTQTNSSRPLGSLAGAEAMVTDGPQDCRGGRAMLLPLAPAALATRAMADSAVALPNGPSTFTRCEATMRSARRRNRSCGSTPWPLPPLRRPPRRTQGTLRGCRTCKNYAKRAW